MSWICSTEETLDRFISTDPDGAVTGFSYQSWSDSARKRIQDMKFLPDLNRDHSFIK